MKSGPDEMPLSTSAYLADTTHLSTIQHGAYMLIIMAMWRAGGWLPDDDAKLATIAKLSPAKWRKFGADVRSLLTAGERGLTQKRLRFLIENWQKISRVNQKNGSAGGAAKALKNKDPALANATFSPPSSPADRQPEGRSALPYLPSDSESKSKNQKKVKKRNTGATLPDGWKPTAEEVAYGIAQGLSEPQVHGIAEDMRLWAAANKHRDVARKDDWHSAFLGWLRREAKKLGVTPGGGPSLFDQGGSGGQRRRPGGGGFARMAAKFARGDDDQQGEDDERQIIDAPRH